MHHVSDVGGKHLRFLAQHRQRSEAAHHGCTINWTVCDGNTSTALIAIFSTDSDVTSSSYYGTSSLFFMRINDRGEMVSSSLVTGENGGPCHDACWSPVADEFLACTGKMPSEIALYDGKTGNKRISFGVSRRNTLRWSPFGRTFIAGGFGNLPGDIDVWDKNKALCLSTVRIPCTVICEWGPDGRHLVSASTFPRMRVDNFAQVANYDGTMAGKLPDMPELYTIKWRPSPTGSDQFEDIPPSPRVVQSARKPTAVAAEEPKKQAYRPPGGSGALAEQMRKERELENQKKAVKVKIERDVNSIPGMTVASGPSASALRNARKKAAALRRQQEGDSCGPTNESSDDVGKPEPREAGATDPAKRIRNLQKKLKEIAALRESGVSLTKPQQVKVDSESAVRAEIAELEKQLQES